MSARTQLRRRRGALAVAVMVAAPACLPSIVSGVPRTWLVGSGTFTVAGNWTGGVVPTSIDDAIIVNADAVARVVTFNPIIGSVKSLTLSNTGGEPTRCLIPLANWTLRLNRSARTARVSICNRPAVTT